MSHEHEYRRTFEMAQARPCRRSRTGAARTITLGALCAFGMLACDDPEHFLPSQGFGRPAGVLDGTVTYTGPLPCTQSGRVSGVAALLAFDVRLLPPPEGIGTSAASVAVVPGDTLFSGVRDRLVFNANGAQWCPAPDAPHVTVSATWVIAPLPGGTYQVRGFYDIDGDFDPGFLISNLPSKGDIGGGAIENAAEVLQGAAPKYREMQLAVGEQGARVQGISVTLGLPLPLDRPVFYPQDVKDTFAGNMDPGKVTMPADFQFDTLSTDPAQAAQTEKSFIRMVLGAGVHPSEVDKAAAPPFNLPVKDPPPSILFTQQDVNGDGKLDNADHVPESDQIPSLYPMSIFAKLAEGASLVNQSSPTVIIQGLTLYKSLLSTVLLMPNAEVMPPVLTPIMPDLEVVVGIRPAALCLHALDVNRPGVLVVTHETDKQGNPIIANPDALKAALQLQFKRPVDIIYGCIPEGRYAVNLIYSTGQAWTVPNDAGICSPLEAPSADGTRCGTRARLSTQAALLTVGPPADTAYCAGAKDAQRIREECYPKSE